MSEEMIGIIITSFISLCSLFLGIRNYFVAKPKLKVIISDPESDVYYGLVSKDNEKVMSTMIGAVDINIINNSPVDIYIKDIKLKIGKDLHRLVLKDNDYYNDIFFFYYDENGEKMWDGSGICYSTQGIMIPVKVKSYTILSGMCLFHDFPKSNSKTVKGKLILNTAIGKVRKNVKFIKYDENYVSAEMKEVELFKKNHLN